MSASMARHCGGKSKRTGKKCEQPAIEGTDRCRLHSGTTVAKARARGQVVVELQRWGLSGEELRDPGVTLLQLMTQSAVRVEFYSSLLGEAYAAAERLREAEQKSRLFEKYDDAPSVDSKADRDRAAQDLERVFNTGGVAALIGHTYSADKEGGVFATGEAIRGLVQLEADERDRCAGMAAKAVAAGLAERQVRLAEQQGALVAELIRGTLGDLGLDPADPVVMRVVSTRLREMAGAA